MNTLSSTNSRRLMWAAFLLLLPGVFMRYAAIGYSWSDPSVWFDFVTNSNAAFQGLMLYVAVFFTLFVKGDRTWKPYFMALASIYSLLGFFSAISQAQAANLPIVKALFKGYVASDPYNGGGPVESSFPVAFLSLVSMIAIIYLSIDSWKVLAQNRKTFTNRIYGENSFSFKVVVGTLLYIGLVILVILSAATGWQNNGFKVWDIFTLVLNFSMVSVLSLFFFSTIKVWWSELVKLASALKDFRLSRYITRMITGYTYTYLFMIVVLIATIGTPIATFAFFGNSYGMQFGWQLVLMVPGFGLIGAAIALSVILVMRLLFETSVALIHIAQNTSR
jgi:hypothetical protein